MKKIFYFLSLVAAAAFTLTSCQEEIKPHEAGEPDVDGCYCVYFPTQEASGSHSIAPEDATNVTFKIARENSDGDITVPIEVTASEDGIFVVPSVSFKNGQKESEFTVSFDNAQIGTTYDLCLAVVDPKYASLYSAASPRIEFSILREKWNQLEGKGLWRDDCLTALFGVANLEWEVDILENDLTKGLYRVVYPYDGKYAYNDPGDWDESKIYYFEIHAENPDKVWFARQDIGVRWGDYGAMRINSLAGMYLANGDAASAAEYYGTLRDGVITFPVKSLLFSMDNYNDGGQYYANGSGMFRVCLPGAILTDFTLKGIETDFANNGQLPVAVYAGMDVPKVDVVIAAGELTPTQVGNQASAIAAGTAENVITLSELEEVVYKGSTVKGAATMVTLPETGVYTVVAVTYDADGEVVDYGSVVTKYVAAGDEEANAVDLVCGIGPAAKYAAQGVNSDTALEIWAYGSDIVDAKIAAIKYIDLVGDFEGSLVALKASASMSEADLEALNTNGYVGVADKLLPGTEYYTVVWASNGYEECYFISDESCYTTGDPLPIYANYTAADYAVEYYPENQSAFVGKTFNCYATDLWGSLGMNEYIGKVTIEDSEIEDEGPDDYGLYDEYVTVKGLGGFYTTEYEFNDAITFDLYEGCLYLPVKTNTDASMNLSVYASSNGKFYSASYVAGFIPVMEGYYAFVDLHQQGYGFSGIAYDDGSYYYGGFCNYILVDPAHDDNGLAPAAKASISLHKASTIKGAVEGKKASFSELSKTRQIELGASHAVSGTCPVKTIKVETRKASVPSVQAQSFSKTMIANPKAL